MPRLTKYIQESTGFVTMQKLLMVKPMLLFITLDMAVQTKKQEMLIYCQ